jgi:hypothetical protein
MGQLAEAKARLAAAGTESERARVEIGLGEKELKAMEPRAKKAASEGEGLGRELVEAKAEVEKLRKGLEGLGWDEEEEKALVAKREEVRGRIAELVEVCPSFLPSNHQASWLVRSELRISAVFFFFPSLLETRLPSITPRPNGLLLQRPSPQL